MSTRLSIRMVALLVGVVATAGSAVPGCASEEPVPPSVCDAGDDAFVRRALVELNGRRAWSRAEVQAWTEVLAKLRAREVPQAAARRAVAQAMMAEEETYVRRWSEVVMDALQVVRALFVRDNNWDKVQAKQCYDFEGATDGGLLASWVRDNSALEDSPPISYFNLGHLLASSIALDDITPIYRAQLFHMLQYPMAGANVEAMSLEAARRTDFSTIFSDAYVHRDPTCLYCHNSETSVTDHPDPAHDRAWPVEGPFEAAIYGNSQASEDPSRYEAIFRVTGVRIPFTSLGGGGFGPWGWDINKCGRYEVPLEQDPLGVDALFGSVTGPRASVWELESAMKRGFELIRGTGLSYNEDGSLDPDAAFAYLVSMNIVNKVWTEVMGSPLTIANYFPRNRAQRDTLAALTDSFVKGGFSLKTLLAEIVIHPMFNLPAPAASCDAAPYSLPPLFNPWSVDDPDPVRHGNSAADIIHPLHARELQRILFHAMDWGVPPAFPSDVEEEEFLATIGAFVASFKPGFRGLGFQAKLAWEAEYGACALRGTEDYITHLVLRAYDHADSTLEDAIVTLKDRLLGEAFIDDLERGPLEALLGSPLGTPTNEIDSAALERGLRLACGAYASSPQFLLGGLAPAHGGPVPALTAPEHGFGPSCEAVRSKFDLASAPYVVTCLGSSLTVRAR